MVTLEKFISLAIKSFEAQELGNSRVVNSCNKKIVKISHDLFESGRIFELMELLTHGHPAVRCNAAIELLPFATEQAEKVLEELSLEKGSLTFFTAKLTLQEWRKGNLKFDCYKK